MARIHTNVLIATRILTYIYCNIDPLLGNDREVNSTTGVVKQV
jgi:hypothetical protein